MAPVPDVEAKLAQPAVYSAQALLGFSTIFNPLAGGFLAYSSLRSVGQMRAASHVLFLSFFFAVFTWSVSRQLVFGAAFSVGLGYVWGGWLWQYMQRKVPGAASYPHKSVGGALLLWTLLSGFLLLFSLGLR
jgi:hypothetical protein